MDNRLFKQEPINYSVIDECVAHTTHGILIPRLPLINLLWFPYYWLGTGGPAMYFE